MSALKDEEGLLHPFLERVQQDNTLMLSIRDRYVNIYYRGGNLLRVTQNTNGTYLAFFDKRYNKSGIVLPTLPTTIRESRDVEAWILAFPVLRLMMDLSFSINNKPEREFQQLIARENNCSSISNETEYFVTDIEFFDSGLGARFDLLAIRWLASERRNGLNCRAALLELKYGDNSLEGETGLLKHLQDMDAFLSEPERYESLLSTMETQFKQLDHLNLLQFKRPINGYEVKLSTNHKPEVIIVLANHNPRKTKLRTILDDPQIKAYGHSQRFDLRFFVASFAGYGFHADCLLPLIDFQQRLS